MVLKETMENYVKAIYSLSRWGEVRPYQLADYLSVSRPTVSTTGIPYLMMCAKVQKVGSVLLMGLITGLIYYVTGQFTVVILVSFVLACGLAEITRVITHYRSMAGNLVSFVLFSVGMVGSPLPIWLMREDFLRQITEQGMPADYVNTLAALSSNGMLIVLFLAPVVGAAIGGILARAMFRKHFEKAGLV